MFVFVFVVCFAFFFVFAGTLVGVPFAVVGVCGGIAKVFSALLVAVVVVSCKKQVQYVGSISMV